MELKDFELEFQLASDYLDERLRHIGPGLEASASKMVSSASCPSFSSMLASSPNFSMNHINNNNNSRSSNTNRTSKRKKGKGRLTTSSSLSNLVELDDQRQPNDDGWQRKRKAAEGPERDGYGYYVGDLGQEELLGYVFHS